MLTAWTCCFFSKAQCLFVQDCSWTCQVRFWLIKPCKISFFFPPGSCEKKRKITFFFHSNFSLEFPQNRSVTLELSFRFANKPVTQAVWAFCNQICGQQKCYYFKPREKRWGWEARELQFTPASPTSSVQKITPLSYVQLPCVSSGTKQLQYVSHEWCKPLPIFLE